MAQLKNHIQSVLDVAESTNSPIRKEFFQRYRKNDPSLGKFITVEGLDMAGKTTNTPFIVECLQKLGYSVAQTREPGGSPLGEEIRSLILNNKSDPYTELILFNAARNEHLVKSIFPALLAGKMVVSDRFADSLMAYQGFGRRLYELVELFDRIVCEDFEPDLTFFFTVDKDVAQQRMVARGIEVNYMDTESQDFKARVEAGYEYQYRLDQEKPIPLQRIIKIDGNNSIGQIQSDLQSHILNTLSRLAS